MLDISTHLKNLAANSVVLLGVPSDENSTFMRGPALAPPRIREVLYCGSANLAAENGVELNQDARFSDLGDVKIDSGQAGFDTLENIYREVLAHPARVLTLGGDHAITFPIIKAYAAQYSNLTILHFDAHPDLYHNFENNPLSHASPFARIMENGLAKRLVQVGIRTLNKHQREQAERFGVEIIEMRHFNRALELSFEGPVYISLDLDGLDPAFAPGVSHHEPGGLTTREVIDIIQHVNAPVVGADVVEYNPMRDYNNITAMVAAKLLKELAGKMLEK